MAKPTLLLIDANALIHRGFHALPPSLTSPRGEQVNAVYGFALMLLRALNQFKPDYAVAAFDVRGPVFREKFFPEYKAQRVHAPEELHEQVPLVKDLLKAFGIPVKEKEGVEADDIIGTLARRAAEKGLRTVILTGDQDTFQLIGAHTSVFTAKRGLKETILITPRVLQEQFGLKPEQMVDYKALRGDPSDNIPGVRGIGEKTAKMLLQRYGNLEEIYAHLSALPPAIRSKLERGKEEAFLSRRLVTIKQNVRIPFALAEAATAKNYQRSRVAAFLRRLGFLSLLGRLPQGLQREVVRVRSQAKTKYQLVETEEMWRKFWRQCTRARQLAVDVETDVLNARHARLLGVAIAWKKGEAYYLPYLPSRFRQLAKALTSRRVAKVGHNLKYDWEVLVRYGADLETPAQDTMLSAWLLNPALRQYSLDQLVFAELEHEMMPISELLGEEKDKRSMAEVPAEKVTSYACEDADYTLRLAERLEKKLREQRLWSLAQRVEFPLVPVLGRMELAGAKLDVARLKKLGEKVALRLRQLERQIHRLAGCRFNVASPVQLAHVLFEVLHLPTTGIRRGQTGFSTAAGELEKLRGKHPVVDLIFAWRELAKLKNTYLDALPAMVDADTGRVHTSYNQTGTATGRLSSSDPNLQNIPVRTELGRAIRRSFVAERGKILLAADYSQIELRVAAHIARDGEMLAAFREGKDIHIATASFVTGKPEEKITASERRMAKTLNFGILYGMGVQSFAAAAGITPARAQQFFELYRQRYRGIAEYVEQIVAAARAQGYVETLLGRRRPLPEINATGPAVRAAAERMAINTPIQGTAADIIKMAMIEVDDFLQQKGEARMILQVHDELVLEVPRGREKFYGRKVKQIMENIFRLDAPLEAEIKTGASWGTLKPLMV
jgi:DNA polymerase-1